MSKLYPNKIIYLKIAYRIITVHIAGIRLNGDVLQRECMQNVKIASEPACLHTKEPVRLSVLRILLINDNHYWTDVGCTFFKRKKKIKDNLESKSAIIQVYAGL